MSPKTGVCLVDLQCGHIWSGTLSLLLGTPILDENRRRPGWEWPAPQPQRSSGREGPTCGWDWLRSSRSSSRPLKQRPLWWPHKWTDWPRRGNCKEHHVTYFSSVLTMTSFYIQRVSNKKNQVLQTTSRDQSIPGPYVKLKWKANFSEKFERFLKFFKHFGKTWKCCPSTITVSQHRFSTCQENVLTKTNQSILHKLFKSFQSSSLFPLLWIMA